MVVLQAMYRINIVKITADEPYFKGIPVTGSPEVLEDEEEFRMQVLSVKELSLEIIQESNLPPDAAFALKNLKNDKQLLNFVCTNMNTSVAAKQQLLECDALEMRAVK